MRKGRPTDDPKKLRIELRLSEKEKEMLKFCMDVYKVPGAEIFRWGLSKMYDAAKERNEKFKKLHNILVELDLNENDIKKIETDEIFKKK